MPAKSKTIISAIQLTALKSLAQKFQHKEQWAKDILRLCLAVEADEMQIEQLEKQGFELQKRLRVK